MITISNIHVIKRIAITSLVFVFMISTAFSKPKYCKLSDRIYFAYNKDLCQQKHLDLVGTGGAMMNDVQGIFASYVSSDRLNIKGARQLYVEVAEGYLCHYNQNAQIRPYLHNYPFTIGNLKIMIGFEDEQHRHMDQGFVAVMSNLDNRIYYCSYDHEKREFVKLYEEPYETARDIVLNRLAK